MAEGLRPDRENDQSVDLITRARHPKVFFSSNFFKPEIFAFERFQSPEFSVPTNI